MGLILDEVIGPDMPAMLWAKANARPIAQPEPAAFRLPFRTLQTLPPPDLFDYRQADLPADIAEQSMDPTIAIPAIIRRQGDDVGGQPLLVRTGPRWVASSGAGQAPGRSAAPTQAKRGGLARSLRGDGRGSDI